MTSVVWLGAWKNRWRNLFRKKNEWLVAMTRLIVAAIQWGQGESDETTAALRAAVAEYLRLLKHS